MMVTLLATGKSCGEKKLPLPPPPPLTSSFPSPHPPISAPLDFSPLLFASPPSSPPPLHSLGLHLSVPSSGDSSQVPWSTVTALDTHCHTLCFTLSLQD